ncbi:hypothetical protein COA17_08590 [Sphingomonas ginsenosidimutans]|jgi:hypothetical protein|uniref:Flagellar FliJ protein n=1 Tax=Sphingomonas ginsenosidimutans TaxID=862134 RepID=A0A2A4HY44_9SPHN|nr:hypothetical protein [Sphingomonas ginsenosidimutans]PCG08961.1 hypothetical protein COA17_08590 [Sphingomonas ginsenosidimutans]
MADGKRLQRLHRVRTLQLNLARADEARAREQVTSEQQLSHRIAQLAAAVAPQPALVPGAAHLAAAAHFRERLHRSADAAVERVRTAEMNADRRSQAARAAHRDQSAVEKLIDRHRAELIRAEMKALEDAPAPTRRR